MTSTTIDKITASTLIDSVFSFTYEIAGVPVDLTIGYTGELRLYQRDTGFSVDSFGSTDVALGDDIGNIQVFVEAARVAAYTVRAGTYEVAVNDGMTDISVLTGCWALSEAASTTTIETITVYDSDEDAADNGVGLNESYLLSVGNIYGLAFGSEKTIADCI